MAASIRSARKEARLTQEDVANLAETSERTIRAIDTVTDHPSLRAVAADRLEECGQDKFR
ncbi:MAG: transcriptional regulator [Specibacter sp.]